MNPSTLRRTVPHEMAQVVVFDGATNDEMAQVVVQKHAVYTALTSAGLEENSLRRVRVRSAPMARQTR